uniref:CSON010861 protein n=1 Tax=Culicoides sonorensis TaxID=179676 RepID=A0A336M6C2_CULSO
MKRSRLRNNYTEFDDSDVQLTNHNNKFRKPVQHTLEATVLEGDTLTSIALRFNCTVADLKRLNKIDKDNEIFAHKILKIPLTPHNILLDTNLPSVHKSGNSSPKAHGSSDTGKSDQFSILSNESLEEKLIVASISNTTYKDQEVPIVKTENDFEINHDVPDSSDPLLSVRRQPKVVLAKPKVDFSFNGSDCDMNWMCLFVCILALCFAIPLIYVYFIYEEKVHPEHHHPITTHSISDQHSL